ncbi:MAG: TMEM175 family protein [Acidimicrobiales bacterium]
MEHGPEAVDAAPDDAVPDDAVPDDAVPDDAAAGADGTPGVERLLTLSDGVVAIALTLLVLQLVVPPIEGVSKADTQSASYLWKQLSHDGGDQFTAYVVSFYVIAQFWLTHHRVFRSIEGHVEGLAWWNFAFLFTITLMPFTSELLGRFGGNPVAIDIFAFNLLLASLATQGVTYFARRHGLQSAVDRRAERTGFFRFVWLFIVVIFTGALAWFEPGLAMICWIFLLAGQWVAERLATRFPGHTGHPVRAA